jgi:hypothetical protein
MPPDTRRPRPRCRWPPVFRWKGDDRAPPYRLVYHEYTQRGLNWDRLKGTDAERAALLRSAADDAGCEAVLAFTEMFLRTVSVAVRGPARESSRGHGHIADSVAARNGIRRHLRSSADI